MTTTYVGGLRVRLIRDNLYYQLKAALMALHWFDVNRQYSPISFPSEEIDPIVEVKINTIGIADGGVTNVDQELGSLLTEKSLHFYIDVFAESDVLGRHLSGDIEDILEGRFPSIGRNGPILNIFDYSIATPTVIFTCQIENVAVDKAQMVTNAWQKHWFACHVTITDTYANENG